MIVGIALSPSLDVTYTVERLHGIQRPLDLVRVAGGKSLNAVRAAAALGVERAAAAAVLAGGAGTDVASHARAHGIDLRVIDGRAPTRTCISVFDLATRELTEIYEHAVAVTDDEVERALAAAVEAMGDAPGWFLISGGMSADHARRAVRRVRDAGGLIALDTHGPALAAGLDEGPDLVKVNRAEAVELLGCAVDLAGDQLVTALHERTCEGSTGARTIVTDGPDGAWARDVDRVVHARSSGPLGGFPVGSGDSFLGGLVAALDTGEALAGALALASGAGIANAQVPGAAVLDPVLARRLASRVDVVGGLANAMR